MLSRPKFERARKENRDAAAGLQENSLPGGFLQLFSGGAQAGRQDDQASGATLYLLHVIDNPFDDLYMSSIAQADPALLGLYKSEPLKRARIVRATEDHSEVLLKQFSNRCNGVFVQRGRGEDPWARIQ
jgi:hypothetical protein